MKILNINEIDILNQNGKGPMLSLYLSVESSIHTSKTIDQRYKDLINQAEFYLLKDYPRKLVDQFLESLNREHDNIISMITPLDKGVAIFQEIRGGFIDLKIMKLQSEIQDLVVVSKSFHIKPLLRIKKYIAGYFVISMSSRAINVMIENQGELVRIESYRNEPNQLLKEKKSYEDFFKDSADDINKLILAYELPVVLCGVRSHISLMKGLLNSTFLLENSIIENIEKIKFDDLQNKINSFLMPYYQKIESNSLRELENTDAVTELSDIAKHAINGNIQKLYVFENKHIWGSIDETTGAIKIHPKQENSFDDDLLDDLCQLVLSKKGEVVVVKNLEHLKDNYALALLKDVKDKKAYNC